VLANRAGGLLLAPITAVKSFTDENTDVLSFDIGSSDCKTCLAWVSDGDGYSVVNDLSGDEICVCVCTGE
jgi:hypothetical protein